MRRLWRRQLSKRSEAAKPHRLWRRVSVVQFIKDQQMSTAVDK